ncbi:UNVERIFIED_CONTAM: Subtilisin-like protease SBT3 [Sesamum calycinum]|uniref:Subtilisin-like protease SBT3 n=1 Tax=Sesamum calycinum TaxID=2727403 RepID=A0AAW2JBL8_9LAMI
MLTCYLRGGPPERGTPRLESSSHPISRDDHHQMLDNTKSPIKDTRSNNKPVTPLAMGASHIDPNKALDPGLIYDASSEDYINLLCALNFTTKHIQAITRLTSYNCKNPSLNLNCPSFITYFYAKDTNSDSTKEQEFQRTVTHMRDRNSVYIAKLIALD